MAFISLRVVRVSCQISQNSAGEALPDAELPLAVKFPLEEELLLEAGVPLEAGVTLGAWLPQADSDSASAAVINGVTSNASRPLILDVGFMPS
jgi:hypothetical protein